MKYKQMVMQRFPTARTLIISRYPDGRPRHTTIIVGEQRLEMPTAGDSDWWTDNEPRGAGHAWREAWLWCLRHPDKKDQSDLFDEEQK